MHSNAEQSGFHTKWIRNHQERERERKAAAREEIKKNMRGRAGKRRDVERDYECLRMRQRGYSMKEIGEKFDISPARVSHLINRAKREIRDEALGQAAAKKARQTNKPKPPINSKTEPFKQCLNHLDALNHMEKDLNDLADIKEIHWKLTRIAIRLECRLLYRDAVNQFDKPT